MKKKRFETGLEALINFIFNTVITIMVVLILLAMLNILRDKQAEKQIEEAKRMAAIEPVRITLVLGVEETMKPGAEIVVQDLPKAEPANELIVEPEEEPIPEEEADPLPVYDIPLDAELQAHIVAVCDTYSVSPELVIGVIAKESGYNIAASGDNGNSQGLMQIQPKWHRERMARLECTDLFDPYQNVLVGVDILAELLSQYQTTEMALMVYNAGAGGAQEFWFSQGIYSTEYSQTVLSIAEDLMA